ncbi:MAG TPA: DUF4855 domain-containing protein [Bacillota bacterium]|nr:DUF4855 domain-containing protein [Bacillota bacterium]HOK69013.1 DUF4855 domain-containing protein [Bacillota bacterium]HPP85778.1 DUF4855 domain-containing protein [Bacillota bacterium]
MKIYDEQKITPVTMPEYWDKSEPDYHVEQNLIAGLPFYIFSGENDMPSIRTHNSPADAKQLTDGVIPTVLDFKTGEWFKCCHGVYRDIVFDLRKTSCVNGFKAVLLYMVNAAIYYPRNFTVSLSENGVDWEPVYKNDDIAAVQSDEICILDERFSVGRKARFVKFSFDVDIWVMIGELEVIGTKAIPETAAEVKPVKEEPRKEINLNKYLMPEEFFGIHDLLLAYNCRPSADEGKITVEQFMPYVAYFDRSGKMVDTFFDAYLFLPFAAFPHRTPDVTYKNWRWYVDNTFEKGYNVDALDIATGKVKQELGLPDYKTKVFLSILYPFKTQTNFGDLYGNGEALDFSKQSDRLKAVKWIIDEQYRRYKERNYQNTELCGFYWFEEQLLTTDAGEREMLRFATDYVHKLGLKVIWIPYFQANGYLVWRDYGIDYACMQPNYSFYNNETDWVLYANERYVKRFGMAYEMEIGGTSDVHIDRYNAYLRVGVETGFMNAVHMYYQGGGPGEFYQAFLSKDKKLNDVYHNTYKFAKHTLTLDFLNE